MTVFTCATCGIAVSTAVRHSPEGSRPGDRDGEPAVAQGAFFIAKRAGVSHDPTSCLGAWRMDVHLEGLHRFPEYGSIQRPVFDWYQGPGVGVVNTRQVVPVLGFQFLRLTSD